MSRSRLPRSIREVEARSQADPLTDTLHGLVRPHRGAELCEGTLFAELNRSVAKVIIEHALCRFTLSVQLRCQKHTYHRRTLSSQCMTWRAVVEKEKRSYPVPPYRRRSQECLFHRRGLNNSAPDNSQNAMFRL